MGGLRSLRPGSTTGSGLSLMLGQDCCELMGRGSVGWDLCVKFTIILGRPIFEGGARMNQTACFKMRIPLNIVYSYPVNLHLAGKTKFVSSYKSGPS